MPARLRIATLLTMVAFAAAPAVALAQSGGAGDQQYVDPFGGQSQQQGSQGSSGSSSPSTAPTAAPSTGSQATQGSSSQASPASTQTLPRTGTDARLVAALGLLLLGAGALIRVRLRDEHL